MTTAATIDDLRRELEATRRELEEVRATADAIRSGEADAIVVETAAGPAVYTLRSADEPYRTIVETLKEGAVTTTNDGVILYCNDAFANLAGRDNGQLTGASLADIFDPSVVIAGTRNGGMAGREYTLARADGSRRETLISTVLHKANGDSIWCWLVTDLTGQTLRLRHAAIIESTDDAVMSFDCDGVIKTWNSAAGTLFGYTAVEAIGATVNDLIPPNAQGPNSAAAVDIFESALSGRKVQVDTQRLAKGGGVIDVSLSASLIRTADDEIVGVSAIMRDIRARKEADARISSIRDALSAEPVSPQASTTLPETRSPSHGSLDAAKRLETVLGLGLLDVPPEQAFDQLTRLAASVLQAPVALITVIDQNRQFFVSSHGLSEPIRIARQKPLSTSYCRHVIESEEPVVIIDAEHNPLVCDIGAWREGFVAYLGVPIRDRDGTVIASMSVADTRARAWTERELLTLQGISRLLMQDVANRAAQKQLALSQKALRRHADTFTQLVEQSPLGIYTVDSQFRIRNVSVGAMSTFRNVHPLIGRDFAEVMHTLWPHSFANEAIRRFRHTLETGEPYVAPGLTENRKDVATTESYEWQINRVPLANGHYGVVCYYYDTTRLQQAYKSARESEERLRLATEAAKIGAFDWNVQTGVNTWTAELEALYGLSPGEFSKTRTAWEQLVYPDDLEGAVAKIDEAFATGKPVETEWRVVWRDGSVHWVAARFQGFTDGSGNRVRLAGVNIDITERKQAEADRARLAAIVESSSDTILSKTLDGIITTWNAAAEHMFGYPAEEMIGASIRRIIPADRQSEEDDIIGRIRRGERVQNYETVRMRKGGSLINVSVTISPVFDDAGRIIGASKIAHDITERKRAEEREHLLMREVNHRAKNMLALVQSIARQTAAGSPEDFIERFTQRVQALSASQDVLVNSGWHNIPMEALVRAQLQHFGELVGRRIRLLGPPLEVNAAAAQAIGLALHELATNASKYGALSDDNGTVGISWGLVGNGSGPRFALSWTESGGPRIAKPTRRGFGSTVTSTLIKMSLDAEVQTDYATDGLVWRMSCSARKVNESGQAEARHETEASANEATFKCTRILVVEDEPIIALEIAGMLERAGFEVLGPVGTVDQALSLIERSGCEAAVLDVNLGNETAEPIARRLLQARVPFLTISGYSREQLPPGFGSAPLIGKPLTATLVIDSLKRCLADA